MKKIREEEDKDDCFKKLPDDVILDIFNRVSDSSKFLIQCLLISKRIASLIRLVSSLSINVHLSFNNVYYYDSVRLRCKFVNPNYSHEDFEFNHCWNLISRRPFFLDKLAYLCIDKAREESHQFSNIKSAIVDYYYSPKYGRTCYDAKVMNWMVEYSSNRGIVKTFAFLGLIGGKESREMTKLGFFGVSNMNIYTWVASLFQTGFSLYPMVARMAQDHESLRDVLITTSSRKGWIHAGEDEIVKMRRTGGSADELVKMVMKMMMEEEIVMMVKVWYISSVYVFTVFGSPDNIDREVKAATEKFWGECSYWAGHDDEKKINIKKWVETKPCDLEFIWIANFEPNI